MNKAFEVSKTTVVTRTMGADVDAVVVGAGFGGLFAVHKLRDELGLNVRA